MSDFKVIETQEDFDRAVSERIRRERETIEGKYADYEQLKSKVTELETENSALKVAAEETKNTLDGHEQEVADLNAKIAGYETASLRTRIALQNGLPIDLADRLTGEDEESIKADAERLAGFMKPATPPPLKSTEASISNGKYGAYKNLLENLNLEGE